MKLTPNISMVIIRGTFKTIRRNKDMQLATLP